MPIGERQPDGQRSSRPRAVWVTRQRVRVGSALPPPWPERNRQGPPGGASLDRLDNVTLFNKAARPGKRRPERRRARGARASPGFAPVAPMCCGAEPLLGLRRRRCVTKDFEATIETGLEILTKSKAYQPRTRNHFCT